MAMRRILDAEWEPTVPALVNLVAASGAPHLRAAFAAAGLDGIRPAQAVALVPLAAGGLHASDLADRLRVSRQAVAQAVAGLERHDYVTRVPHPAASLFLRPGWETTNPNRPLLSPAGLTKLLRAPSFVILNEAKRSRRTRFLPFWRKGGKQRTSTRPAFIRPERQGSRQYPGGASWATSLTRENFGWPNTGQTQS